MTDSPRDDNPRDGTSQPHRFVAVRRRWGHWRDGIRERPRVEFFYRIAVGVVGLVVLAVGIVAIPYPGPGWAIVFVGLGILATEFRWAQRLLVYAKHRYDEVMEWFHRQGAIVQILGGVLTALIVAGTLWLLGALDWAGEFVGLEYPWLKSPIGVGG
ncbi:TIGR02611 family protein [Mycobacterium sp. 852013-51886_SCH5428379]|uniref:TIGR02611 family protein n=1 Tax=Mycobacteriaceae TaxID=1762 RepID=UPI0008019206|nr:TIGR02611 family protein [Mycobacterium sp. 852013-51886_SCH5428379]